ncbi:hypothetical protein AVEN_6748-1 [Araneus ventricosus]|uniref:Uncharacterized protein n=1 Tax=Araneus ventricosus TaxID=182803 RepID=A0A4Y2RQR9_ARAVE|nr:hypothetical protein AVEN_6748-1 [Araneus ventricosus]
MKFLFGYLMVAFAAFCTGECIGDPEWRNDLPSFFKRQYRTWSSNDTCHYERIKSLPANEFDTFLENKENVTAFPFKYHTYLLKVTRAAQATPGSYFSYKFRDSQSIKSFSGAAGAFRAFNQILTKIIGQNKEI